MVAMTGMDLLRERVRATGRDVAAVTEARGGVVATAGLLTLDEGGEVFAKTLHGPDSDVFQVEAEGLRALRERGGARTPDVLAVTANLLVLAAMRPRGEDGTFWEAVGRDLAALHARTVGDHFGRHRDGWLGRMRQDNTPGTDGYAFFAERRILRWLPEPLVQQALGPEDRRALERLCAALPDLVPPAPPVLTHGDMWSGNLLADETGAPVFIDPAVSCTWAEVDLAMLWCGNRPPAAERAFGAYAEVQPLADGWRERMPLLHLPEVLSIIAHGDDDWGAADEVRRVVAPFARRHR